MEDTHVTQICSAHGQAPLSYPSSLTKSKFMDKIIVNFKMASRALQCVGLGETAQVEHPWTWPWVSLRTFCSIQVIALSCYSVVSPLSLLCFQEVIGTELFLLSAAWCSNQKPERHSISSLSLKVQIPSSTPINAPVEASRDSSHLPSPPLPPGSSYNHCNSCLMESPCSHFFLQVEPQTATRVSLLRIKSSQVAFLHKILWRPPRVLKIKPYSDHGF